MTPERLAEIVRRATEVGTSKMALRGYVTELAGAVGRMKEDRTAVLMQLIDSGLKHGEAILKLVDADARLKKLEERTP